MISRLLCIPRSSAATTTTERPTRTSSRVALIYGWRTRTWRHTEPTPAQVHAFLLFLADQQLICTTIVDAIFGYYGPHRERWRTGDTILDDITVPPVQSPDDLKRLIRLQHLRVLDMSKDDCSLIAFRFACSWDIEHGLGVLIHGANVVEVADSDITRIGPSSDW